MSQQRLLCRLGSLHVFRFLGCLQCSSKKNCYHRQRKALNRRMLSLLNLFLCFRLSLYLLSPSSTSSLKVRSASSFLTTELPRGCGRCASSITPSSGKNRLGLVVGGLPFRLSVGKKHLIRFTASLGAVRSCVNIYESYIKPFDP